MKPKLKATRNNRLILKSGELLSNFAFKFNSRRYNQYGTRLVPFLYGLLTDEEGGRGLHSSTLQLNLSRF